MKAEYLITGGGGFIGSNIVRTLVAAEKKVRVLDNFSTGRPENLLGIRKAIDLVEGDIRDTDTVRRAARGVRFVIHTAALPSVVRSVKDPLATNSVNVCGTLKVLQAARAAHVERVVFSSSSSIYGNTKTLPKREDMMPCPMSPYALSKLTGEHYARLFFELYGLKTFSLRYFNVFGPRQDPKSQYAAAIPRFIDALRRGRRPVIYGDGKQTRDFTFVEDVVAANLACCSAPAKAAGMAFNVGGGGRISINDLVAHLARVLGRPFKPAYEPSRPGDVRDSQAAIERARKFLRWRPRVGLDEGLRKTVQWFDR